MEDLVEVTGGKDKISGIVAQLTQKYEEIGSYVASSYSLVSVVTIVNALLTVL